MSFKFGNQNILKEKVYFFILYDEKENAKKLGYKWDVTKKCWYKFLEYSKNLELHYDIHKYNNEPHIYEKYNELICLYDKKPIIDEEDTDKIERTKDLLYSA